MLLFSDPRAPAHCRPPPQHHLQPPRLLLCHSVPRLVHGPMRRPLLLQRLPHLLLLSLHLNKKKLICSSVIPRRYVKCTMIAISLLNAQCQWLLQKARKGTPLNGRSHPGLRCHKQYLQEVVVFKNLPAPWRPSVVGRR